MHAGTDIAILCSGSSLAAFLAAPVAHHVYIGVNRTPADYPCDWWAFNDDKAFTENEPIAGSHPKLFTANETFRRIRTEQSGEPPEYIDAFEWTFYPQIATTCPSDPGWVNYSMTIAMVLAEYLGAKELTLYGCDQAGVNDWDGKPPPRQGRGEHRWQNEKHKCGHVAKWLRSRGVSLRRMVAVDGSLIEGPGM